MQQPRQSKRIRMIKDPGDAPMGVSVFRSTGPARMFGIFGVFVGLGLCVTGIVVVVGASIRDEGSDAKVFQYTFIILVGFFMTAGSFVLIQSAKTKEVIDAEAAQQQLQQQLQQQTATTTVEEEQGGGEEGGGGKAANGSGGGGGGDEKKRGGKGGNSATTKDIELTEKNGRQKSTDSSPTEKSKGSPPAATTTAPTKSSGGRAKKAKTESVEK